MTISVDFFLVVVPPIGGAVAEVAAVLVAALNSFAPILGAKCLKFKKRQVAPTILQTGLMISLYRKKHGEDN